MLRGRLSRSSLDSRRWAGIVGSVNRRSFFKSGGAAAFLAGAAPLFSQTQLSAASRSSAGRAKNVIFMVSDGMSAGTLSLADQFIRWRDGRSSHWIRLYEEGIATRGLVETASLDSIVTDSAAGAAAWGCGKRVNNGSVNIGPDGEEHPPILVLAKGAGKATGLVTTATATHATPSGFAANVHSRQEQSKIAEQYLERQVDLIFGGGRRFFDPAHREDGRDLTGEYVQAGYRYVRTAQELEAGSDGDGPILGLFAHDSMPFEIDRIHSERLRVSVPSLAEMTRRALRHLNQKPNGFIVQIEGARIDHAAHANDIGGLLFDQIAFDEAIGVVIDFVKENPDTLVVLTTDHGNANPGLNSGSNGGERNFRVLSQFRGSHNAILSEISAETSLEVIGSVIRKVTGIEISEENAALLRNRLGEAYRAPYHRMNGVSAVLGQILANHTDIGWVGGSHTSDHVEVAAFGPGSDGVKAFQPNTALFGVMTDALGIKVEAEGAAAVSAAPTTSRRRRA